MAIFLWNTLLKLLILALSILFVGQSTQRTMKDYFQLLSRQTSPDHEHNPYYGNVQHVGHKLIPFLHQEYSHSAIVTTIFFGSMEVKVIFISENFSVLCHSYQTRCFFVVFFGQRMSK